MDNLKALYRDFRKENFLKVIPCGGFFIAALILFISALKGIIRGQYTHPAEITVLMIISGIWLIPSTKILFPFVVARIKFEWFIKTLDDREKFLRELTFSEKLNIWHSGEYLVDFEKLNVIKCSEILLCYGQTQYRFPSGLVDFKWVVCKSRNKKVRISMKNLQVNSFNEIYKFIWLFNADCLFGRTKENVKTYRKLKKRG